MLEPVIFDSEPVVLAVNAAIYLTPVMAVGFIIGWVARMLYARRKSRRCNPARGCTNR